MDHPTRAGTLDRMLARDISSPRVLYLKGTLFVFLGLLAGGLLLWRHPDWRSAALLATCVWAFCRAYYFAFYVVERYVDPGYRYAGLWDFAKYALRRRRA